MDLKTFIVELIDKLIWPITLIVSVILFRKQVIKLIPNFKKLKYGKLELEFQKELADIKQETNKVRPLDSKMSDDYLVQDIIENNETYPRGAILQAWISLETSILTTMRHFGLLSKDENLPFFKILRRLRDEEYINPDVYGLIDRLRKLRNEVVHSHDLSISTNEVKDFIILSREMTEEVVGEIASRNSGC